MMTRLIPRMSSSTNTRCASILPAVVVGLATIFATACDDATQAPPFPEGQGQAPPGSGVEYAPGPYGIERGSTISNFKFVGFPNPSADKNEAFEIQLADFYNPTGDGVFPEGSPLGEGEPKPQVVLMNISALWCQPCQLEAEKLLPGNFDEYSPHGVQFLLVLVDGPNQGVPATQNHLVAWTNKYETRWPATIDPAYTLGSLFKGGAFPVNIVLDTRTMKIVEAVAGLPEEEGPLFEALDDLIE